jgi:CDP-diacylglycerol--glycerol-3-phosphate 3-phosphatidyltransferase
MKKPLRELDLQPSRRSLAGFQMGFLAVALWPAVPAPVTLVASYLFGCASLAMFVRDWLYVSCRFLPASAPSLR